FLPSSRTSQSWSSSRKPRSTSTWPSLREPPPREPPALTGAAGFLAAGAAAGLVEGAWGLAGAGLPLPGLAGAAGLPATGFGAPGRGAGCLPAAGWPWGPGAAGFFCGTGSVGVAIWGRSWAANRYFGNPSYFRPGTD